MSAPNNFTALTEVEARNLLRLVDEKDGGRKHFKGKRAYYWLSKLAALDDVSEMAFDNSRLNDYVIDQKRENPGFVEGEKGKVLNQMGAGIVALRRALRAFYREFFPNEKAVPTLREAVWRLVWEIDRKAPEREVSSESSPSSNWLVEPLQHGDGEIAFYLPVNDRDDVPKRFAVFGGALREHFSGIEKRLRPFVLSIGETLSLAGYETVLAIGPLRWNRAAVELLASAGRNLPPLADGQGRVTRLAVGKTAVVIIEAEDTARATVLLRRVKRGEGGVQRVGADGFIAVDLQSAAIVTG